MTVSAVDDAVPEGVELEVEPEPVLEGEEELELEFGLFVGVLSVLLVEFVELAPRKFASQLNGFPAVSGVEVAICP